jgi:hypothetical protein
MYRLAILRVLREAIQEYINNNYWFMYGTGTLEAIDNGQERALGLGEGASSCLSPSPPLTRK